MRDSIIKIVLFYISLILIFISVSSCSEEEPPPLNDFLIGTYNEIYADYQPDSTNNHIYPASSTGSTYLTINSNGSYKMSIELFAEVTSDSIIIIQEGSYSLTKTRYVEVSGWTAAHWEGIIEFKPIGASNWGGEFWIESSTSDLLFTHLAYVNIPNSKGRLAVYHWGR